MPSSLPDPVLALSMDNVQKLNDLNLDQLANLWNVFTKCKESLESGRRLENLSWRLWFREAHILPPDTSLSDLTDFTPLDTPLISRANSIAGSYQHSRHSSLLNQVATQLSDPEFETDTDTSSGSDLEQDNDHSEPESSAMASSRFQNRGRSFAGVADSVSTVSKSSRSTNRPQDTTSSRTSSSEVRSRAASRNSSKLGPSLVADLTAERDSVRDRKRAISSSSAFGSRARVKQRNQSCLRRRPLSFQAAIENLYLDGGNDALTAFSRKRPSMSGLANEMIRSTGALDAPARPELDNTGTAERSSAPAEYSSTTTSQQSHALLASPSRREQARDSHIANTNAIQSPTSPIYERCTAPETNGPISPSKMEIATGLTLGAVTAGAAPAKVLGIQESQTDAASQLMPPPPSVPVHTPAAAAFKSNAQRRKPVPSSFESKDAVTNSKPVEEPRQAQAAEKEQQQPEPTTKFYLASPESNASVSTVQKAEPMQRSDSHQSNATTTAPAGHTGKAKPARTKSATGLHRANRHSKSSDRIAGRQNSHARLGNVFGGLAMTKASAAVPAASKKSAASANKKKPVTFTMGGDDSDSFEDEEYEDEEDEGNPVPVKQQAAAPAGAKKETPVAAAEQDDDDDDAWSSDPEAEEAERKAQAAVLQARRRREEEERQKSMFQKIPIRSKSAADVRFIPAGEPTSNGPSPPAQPVRGLLSSLFHPDEQHSPPGQLAGRPHASAADLRAKPSLPSGLALTQVTEKPASRRSKNREHAPNPAVLSASQGAPLAGGLRTSKSAVALPLLDRSVTRSSTAGKASQSPDQSSSPESSAGAKPSSVAMAKLNALTNMRSHANRDHKRRSSEAEEAAAREAEARALRLEVSPGGGDDSSMAAQVEAHAHAHPNAHPHASRTQSTPQLQHQHPQQPHLGARSKSQGPPEPIDAPGIARNRSNLNLPEAAAPQTPRTTRRNMLRDELSESVRQNLLWERQSRTRMLGIGAPAKKETVLGGNQLRPLTSAHPQHGQQGSSQLNHAQSQSHTQSQSQSSKPKRYSEEWGSFHHKGW